MSIEIPLFFQVFAVFIFFLIAFSFSLCYTFLLAIPLKNQERVKIMTQNQTLNVRYFKRDKLVDWEDDVPREEENLEVVFRIVNGTRLDLTKTSLNVPACMTCSSTPWSGVDNSDLKSELLWLAVNQRGIFRLIALLLRPYTKAYQDIAILAAEHGITI